MPNKNGLMRSSARQILLLSLLASLPLGSNAAWAQTQVATIVLPVGGMVQVTVTQSITNNCDGDLGLQLPEQKPLITNYNSAGGKTVEIGPYPAGTELVFYIEPHSFCSTHHYLSTNTAHSRITGEDPNPLWEIKWEDLPDSYPPDNDFNDLIMTVRVTGYYPDFKQNDLPWAPKAYAFNDEGSSYTIAYVGCALTAAANVLAYYGDVQVTPLTLNDWLKTHSGYDAENGVRWEALPNYTRSGSTAKVVESVQTAVRANNAANFDSLVAAHLAQHWPVVLQIDKPQSASRIHFVVATEIVTLPNGTQAYTIRDPYRASDELTSLAVQDARIQVARLYKPTDGVPRSVFSIAAHSPVQFLVTDSQGRRQGFDPLSENAYSEIPDAAYFYNAPYWTPDGAPSRQGEGQEMHIPDAATGTYDVKVFGTGTGEFTVDGGYLSTAATFSAFLTTGTVTAGTTLDYRAQLSTTQSTLTLERRATLVSSRPVVPTGGTTQVVLTLTDAQGQALTNRAATFQVSSGSILASAVTDAQGKATVLYTAEQATSSAKIVATVEGVTVFLPLAVFGPIHLPGLFR